MAATARALAEGNPAFGGRVQVLQQPVETLQLDQLDGERVDMLVSEPLGTLLFNERMIESYLFARDHFLKPGGKEIRGFCPAPLPISSLDMYCCPAVSHQVAGVVYCWGSLSPWFTVYLAVAGLMFPRKSRLFCAPFMDAALFTEVAARGAFWQNDNFYGVDLRRAVPAATDEAFRQPIVGACAGAVVAAAVLLLLLRVIDTAALGLTVLQLCYALCCCARKCRDS